VSFLALSALASLSLTAVPAGLGAQDYISLLPPMEWRSIGPDRGGRSIAVAGHAARPFEYYFGATGGGLFKTTDGGTTWSPVTDGQVGSASVGAATRIRQHPATSSRLSADNATTTSVVFVASAIFLLVDIWKQDSVISMEKLPSEMTKQAAFSPVKSSLNSNPIWE